MAVLIAVFGVAAGAQLATPTVTVESGKLAGNEKDGMMWFLGIPYAAPPTGDLRWRAPQPVKAWQGTRQAAEVGPVCRQTADWQKAPQSEDCLTLNVWAPVNKASKPYPVLLYIHGGGFVSGSGDWGPDGGKSIVQNGVIFVTMNYRLGVFGFFAHPELSAEASDHASGNQGMRDQITALQWIQHNIAAFGGDPDRITIAGESSGANSVTALTVSPLAKGLFQRGIVESGVVNPLAGKATAERLGTEFGKALRAPHLGDLRKLSAEDLLKQDWQAMLNLDTAVFTEQPQQSFAAGHQNKVPVLIGWNADEGVDNAPPVTAANYESQLQRAGVGPQFMPFVLARYPGKTDAQAMASAQRLATDWLGQQHFYWATMQQKTNTQPAYIYFYVHSPAEPSAGHPCTFGCKAGHSAEMRFAYGQLWKEPRAWNKDDLAMQKQMLGYWTNFAKTGDPNSEGLPRWGVFDGTPDTVQRLGSAAEITERGNFPDFRQPQWRDGWEQTQKYWLSMMQ